MRKLTWKFCNGQFELAEELRVKEVVVKDDGADDVEVEFKDRGFNSHQTMRLGHPHSDQYIAIHENAGNENFDWLIEVSNANQIMAEIFVESFPDLLACLKFMKPLIDFFRDNESKDDVHTLMEVAEKVFRSWHGHSWWASCNKCDPDAVKATARMRQEYRESQEAKGKKVQNFTA